MNVFARSIMMTVCASAAVLGSVVERAAEQNGGGAPASGAGGQGQGQGQGGGGQRVPETPRGTPERQPDPVPRGERGAEDGREPEAGGAERRGAAEERARQDRYPRLEAADVDGAIAGWDPRAKQAARAMIARYGEPNEMTSRRLYWYENGPWLWTCVRSEPVMHNWPRAHAGVIEQAAALRIPLERVGEMARFSGAVVIDRNAGIVTSRNESEAANILAINLVHQISQGTRDAESARREYEKFSLSSGEPSPLSERFTFAPAEAGAGDPDREVGVPGTPGAAGAPAATPVTASPLPIERPRVPDDEKKRPR